jgi:hypothetical protein
MIAYAMPSFVTLIYHSVVQALVSAPLPSSNPRSKPKKTSKSHAAAAAPHSWAVGVQCLARCPPSPSPRLCHIHAQSLSGTMKMAFFILQKLCGGSGTAGEILLLYLLFGLVEVEHHDKDNLWLHFRALKSTAGGLYRSLITKMKNRRLPLQTCDRLDGLVIIYIYIYPAISAGK